MMFVLIDIASAILAAAQSAREGLVRRKARRQLGLREMRPPPSSTPVLNYGGVAPLPGHLAHGGRVKLRHLAERYPESAAFNLLYLVSSALPDDAVALAQWAKRRGARIVLNQNGVGFSGWAGAWTETVNAPMRAVRRLADVVLYQTDFCRRTADRFLGPSNTPFRLIYNPVDCTQFHPRPEPLETSVWRLLAAGSHGSPARVLSALECIRALRDRGKTVHFTLAGRLAWRNAEADLASWVARLELSGHFERIGAYSQDDAPEVYRSAHVLLHPKYNDPCPTVVLEALASGLPVVGSRSGGLPELVPSEAGVLIDVPPDDFRREHVPSGNQLADAVESLFGGNLEASSCAARRAALDNFHNDLWVDAHAEPFRLALGLGRSFGVP